MKALPMASRTNRGEGRNAFPAQDAPAAVITGEPFMPDLWNTSPTQRKPWRRTPILPDPTSEAPMSKKRCILSRECVDRLHAWIMAHCPCSLEDPEFFRGLLVVVDMEVRDAVDKVRASAGGRLKPSRQ